MGHVSPDVYILSSRDLDAREQAAYRRGVERGRLEESMARGNQPVAINCIHWKDGRCEWCGSQTQGMEVSGEFKCPHFERRAAQAGEPFPYPPCPNEQSPR